MAKLTKQQQKAKNRRRRKRIKRKKREKKKIKNIAANKIQSFWRKHNKTNWVIRYIDSGEASQAFVQRVDNNGDLHIIEELWVLIKAFMIMSDEQRNLCREVFSRYQYNTFLVKNNRIVECFYFRNFFNSLEKISLSWENIGNKGSQFLSKYIKASKSLSSLNLWDNQIGDDGAKYLAEGIKDSKSLSELDLGINRIGPDGAKYLAEGIKASKSLASLDLYGNSISKASKTLLENSKPEHLTIEY